MFLHVKLQASTPDSIDGVVQRLLHRFRPSIHEPGRPRPLGFNGHVDESGFQLTKPVLMKAIPVTMIGTFQRAGNETVVRARIQPVKSFYLVIVGVIGTWGVFCAWAYFNRSAESSDPGFVNPEIFISTCVCAFVMVWLLVSTGAALIYLRSVLKNTIQSSLDLKRY